MPIANTILQVLVHKWLTLVTCDYPGSRIPAEEKERDFKQIQDDEDGDFSGDDPSEEMYEGEFIES
jgi:hypothetical protein